MARIGPDDEEEIDQFLETYSKQSAGVTMNETPIAEAPKDINNNKEEVTAKGLRTRLPPSRARSESAGGAPLDEGSGSSGRSGTKMTGSRPSRRPEGP